MKLIVNPHKIEIVKEPINEKEINITKCYFEFADEITSEFVKDVYFTFKNTTYKVANIQENECDIPYEVLKEKGTVEIGVVAYLVENEVEIKRYNPSPAYFNSWVGSLKEEFENSEPITPTDKEQFAQQIQNGLNDIQDKIDEVDTKLDTIDDKIEEIDTAIEETNTLDLDVNKSGKVATVTLTKKDATTKVVTLSDGTSLMFNWQGTSLGIKTENDAEYTYVDLQGIQGQVGPQGEPFRIKKTYSSVAEMNTDFNNMEYGDYVMIASSVEIEDNAKLYTRGESAWIFITDFSGSQGIRGETGLTPNISIGTVVSGATSSVTRTGTDENPILNFVLEKGDKGDVGSTGDTGNGISTITKTSTSGLVDTYTITYTNGNTSTFTITNGRGISNISKTSTSGSVDTYTITYNDGTTSTFDITNGEVTQAQLDETNEEVARANMVYNALPKVTEEGTSITLNNTAECPMKMIPMASELEQESTSGKNLWALNSSYTTTTGEEYVLRDTTIPTITAGTYTLSLKKSANSNVLFNFKDANDNENKLRLNNVQEITTTFASDIKKVAIYIYGNVACTISDIQLELGSTATSYEPYTGGNPAPNPDYPQDIHTISGNNKIKIQNKNLAYDGWAEDFVSRINSSSLASITTKDGKKCLKFNRTAGYGDYDNKYLFKTEWKENTQYVLSCDLFAEGSRSYANIQIRYTDGTINDHRYDRIVDSWKKFTFISEENKTIKDICASYFAGNNYIDLDTFMIEQNTSATNYVPHQEQTYPLNLGDLEYCKIGDYEDRFIKTRGKNLLNGANPTYLNLATVTQEGNITKVSSRSTETYPFGRWHFSINSGDSFRLNAIIQNQNGAILIQKYKDNELKGDVTLKYIDGTTISTYLYTNDGSFDEIRVILYSYLGIPSSASESSYRDVIVTINNADMIYESYGKDEWYLKKNIGKVVLDGSETNWNKYTTTDSGGNTYGYFRGLTLKPVQQQNIVGWALSSHFQQKKRGDVTIIDDEGFYMGNNNYLFVKISQSLIQDGTLENFQNWLSNNNTTIDYVLETPQYIPLNDTLQTQLDNIYCKMLSYQGQTNISQTNNDLPFNIKTSAVRDMSNIFELIQGTKL